MTSRSLDLGAVATFFSVDAVAVALEAATLVLDTVGMTILCFSIGLARSSAKLKASFWAPFD